MKKQITLEFIDGNEEYNKKGKIDSDMDNDLYEQDFNIKNPKIPDSLRTPEPSQKRILEIKNKQSKLDASQIDLNSENIYNSRNSNALTYSINTYDKSDIQLKKSKTQRKIKPRNSGFINNKNTSKNNLMHKVYSYRRPFSKKKRKFIFVLICLINIFINLDKGAIPAGTTEIKDKNNIANAELGMIGSLLYFGLILGSLTGGYFFSKYSSKWIVILSLFIFCFFLYSFTILESCGGMYLSRIGCGFCEVFCLIYFPIWVDQYGVKGMKTIWLTFLQIGIPLGTILGYLIEACSIKYYHSWEGGFIFQIILLCSSSGILFLTPDKFFERNYRHSESTQEEIENEFKTFKELLTKQLRKNQNKYLLNNMNLINDVYNSKYGRPSLYSIFSMIDTEEEYGTKKYCNALTKLAKNKNYISTMFGISCSLFVVTGIQFWISDYMQEVIHFNSSETYIIYTLVCISAPTLGVLTGGILIQYLGGYTTCKAIDACSKLTFIGFICSCILPIFEIPILFVFIMWLLLFFESSVTPGLTGLMISSIPDNYKELGNSITQLCYNLIGFLPSPYIYGLVSSYTGGGDSKWGLSVIILWSFFGFISLIFAKKIFNYNQMNEIDMNKEYYLENILENKNSHNSDIFNNDFGNDSHEYKRSQTYNSNFSTEVINELYNNNNNNKITNSTNNDMHYNINQKSNIITNLYGGINHI